MISLSTLVLRLRGTSTCHHRPVFVHSHAGLFLSQQESLGLLSHVFNFKELRDADTVGSRVLSVSKVGHGSCEAHAGP